MKHSKYNLTVHFKFNQYVLHNMLHKSTIILNSKEFKNYRNMTGSDEFKNSLKKLGFYQEDRVNEVVQALKNTKKEQKDFKTLNITLVPTFACNLSCVYCYQNGLKNDIISDKNLEIFIKFVEKRLIKYESKTFHLSWFGGEPLLFFDKIELTNLSFQKFCKERKIKFTSSIATNLTLVTKEMVDRMKNLGIIRVETTLCGDEKKHNLLRPSKDNFSNSFKNTLNGIQLVSKKINTLININYCRENIASIRALLKKYPCLRNKRVFLNFNAIQNYEQNRKEVKEIKDCNYNFKLLKYALRRDFQICDTTNFCKQSLFCAFWHYNSFAVDNMLKIYKCTEDFGACSKIGEIDKKTFEIVLNRKVDSQIKKDCFSCAYLPYCNGGCAVKRCKNICPCPEELSSVKEYLKLFVRRQLKK